MFSEKEPQIPGTYRNSAGLEQVNGSLTGKRQKGKPRKKREGYGFRLAGRVDRMQEKKNTLKEGVALKKNKEWWGTGCCKE